MGASAIEFVANTRVCGNDPNVYHTWLSCWITESSAELLNLRILKQGGDADVLHAHS